MIDRLFCCLLLTTLVACPCGFADDAELRIRNDAIIVRAAERMSGVDFSNNDHVRQAIERHLKRRVGTAEYVELADRFRPQDMVAELAKMIASDLDDSTRVRSIDLLLSTDDGREYVQQSLQSDATDADTIQSIRQISSALALLGKSRGREMLGRIASDSQRPYEHRKHVVMAMSRNPVTSKQLLSLAEKQKLPADTRMLTGGLLARSSNSEVRQRAAKLFPQAQQKDHKPLPPIDQLAQMKGDAAAGAKWFRGVATCATCHLVAGEGKSVGPDLTEIGSKLSREAMLTSILDPSAGISHNYEQYVVLTFDGQVINGLLISKTDQQVVIRTTDAIDRQIASDDIETIKQSKKSIMPDNLHQTMDQQGLVDLIEYMTTLRKR